MPIGVKVRVSSLLYRQQSCSAHSHSLNAASAGSQAHSGPLISKDDMMDVDEEQNFVDEPDSDAEDPHTNFVSNVKVF